MSDGEDDDQRLLEPIKDDITAVAKTDQPFPKPRVHVIGGTARSRLSLEDLDARADRLHGATRGVRILRDEEPMKSLDVS